MVKIDDIKNKCKNLLEEGKVKYIVGYKKRNDSYMSVPAFFEKIEDVDQLVWNPSCVYNLVRFLRDEKIRKERQKTPDTRPIGLVVKGCDSRAINVLLQEKFIKPEDVYVIGVACEKSGVIEKKKLLKKFDEKNIKQIEFGKENNFVITTEKGKTTVPAEEILAEKCIECNFNTPVVYDVLFGEKVERAVSEPFKSLEKLESISTEEKWNFWKKELDKCIRCYACRSVCPMCYCDECVADSIILAVKPDTTAEEKAGKIRWVEKSSVSSENFNYHLVRALHLAGRCIDCGECERVCPVDIPLRFLNKKMEKEASEKFGYMAGMDPQKPALVSDFKDDDPQDFIL
jgi:formate dehydrogenase subunit beta